MLLQLRKYTAVFFAALWFAAPAVTAAEWQLDNGRSSLTYLSSKLVPDSLAAIFEPNRFSRFSGSISAAGKAEVVIDMTSVETGVEIRDQRVMEHVFMTAKYPQATIALSLPSKAAGGSDMAAGRHDIKAVLTMRGRQQEVAASVRVDHLKGPSGKDILVVQSIAPVLIQAKDYGMLDGFDKLRELVGLFNIPTTIPVSFSFVFVGK